MLGDIAHNIHPIAGKGLNLSIKDIAVFVNQIKKYKSLGYRLNDQMVWKSLKRKEKWITQSIHLVHFYLMTYSPVITN